MISEVFIDRPRLSIVISVVLTLAGLIAIRIAGAAKPSDAACRCAIAIGMISLVIGAYFAIT